MTTLKQNFLNANGLIQGKIPIGDPCPFADGCRAKTDNCPTFEKPKEVPFSCALARLQSMIRLQVKMQLRKQ